MLQTRHAPAADRARARARRRPGARPARTRRPVPRAPSSRSLAAARLAGPVLWLQPAWSGERPMGDGIRAFLDPARLVFGRAAQAAQSCSGPPRRRCASASVPLVVADLPAPPALTAVRRLHLAAEAGAGGRRAARAPPHPRQRRRARHRDPLAARPRPRLGRATARPRWRLTRTRARMAPEASWEAWLEGGRLRLAPAPEPVHLVRPAEAHLAAYVDALAPRLVARQRPRPETADEQLAAHRDDPGRLPRRARPARPAGATIDAARRHAGSPRLPGFVRWMWDGELAGSINLRWQPGTGEPAAARPRPCRLRRRPLEAAPRPCHPRPRPAAAGGPRARAAPRRADRRARKPRLAPGHRAERRPRWSTRFEKPAAYGGGASAALRDRPLMRDRPTAREADRDRVGTSGNMPRLESGWQLAGIRLATFRRAI